MQSLSYDQLNESLWVGSYPQQPEDVLHLKALGVNAILNLQSNADLDARAVNWDLFWRFYIGQGFQVVRVAITDFDDAALERGLPGAVDALANLLNEGRRVYLHCTAGINRSPTVAIAWHAQHGGLSLDDAIEHVTARRQCHPCLEVLRRWAKQLT